VSGIEQYANFLRDQLVPFIREMNLIHKNRVISYVIVSFFIEEWHGFVVPVKDAREVVIWEAWSVVLEHQPMKRFVTRCISRLFERGRHMTVQREHRLKQADELTAHAGAQIVHQTQIIEVFFGCSFQEFFKQLSRPLGGIRMVSAQAKTQVLSEAGQESFVELS
jgi:hypothetical protein